MHFFYLLAETTSFTPASKLTNRIENSYKAVKAKKARMELVKTSGFIETNSSHIRKIVWYYKKNIDELFNYFVFLESSKDELIDLLKLLSINHPIKYNLKLEATYKIPHVDNSSENRAFKTTAKEIFTDTDIKNMIEKDFTRLLQEEDEYIGKGSGFTLECNDGLLLGVYKYTPMGGSSYVKLPNDIKNKKAVINPQNTDQQCFKWAILTKYVDDSHLQHETRYTNEEHRYDFSGLTFPTPIAEIKIFERNNSNVSVNVYGLNQDEEKNHIIYPLKVVNEEKSDHFDLLLLCDDEKSHYTYISNFSRLVRTQRKSFFLQEMFYFI